MTIILNKNVKKLKNNAIITDIVLVVITIIIPIILLRYQVQVDLLIVPLFIILYMLFVFLNNRVHKLYLNEKEENDQKIERQEVNKVKILQYVVILIITGGLLFIIGELLGNTLEVLCNFFGVPEFIIGILLGVITSIPELMTFFESQQYNKKNKNEMFGVVEATNNLLTSNILNLFVIQTIGILIISI